MYDNVVYDVLTLLVKDVVFFITIALPASCTPILHLTIFYLRRRIHPNTVRNRLRSFGLKARLHTRQLD